MGGAFSADASMDEQITSWIVNCEVCLESEKRLKTGGQAFFWAHGGSWSALEYCLFRLHWAPAWCGREVEKCISYV